MPSRKRKQPRKVKEKKLTDDASSDHMTHTNDVISDDHVMKLITKPTTRAVTRHIPRYSDSSLDVNGTNPKRRKPTSRATTRLKRNRSESPEVVQIKILCRPSDHKIILAGRVSQKEKSFVAKPTASFQSQAINLQKPTTGFLENFSPKSNINSEEILVKPKGRKSAARRTTLQKQAHPEGRNREVLKRTFHSEDQMPPSDPVIPHDKAIISLSNSTQKQNQGHSGHQDVEPQETIQSRFKKKFANILKSIVNRDTAETKGVDSVADTSIIHRKGQNYGANVCDEGKTEPLPNCQEYTTFSAREELTNSNGKELGKGRFQGQRKSDNNGKELKTVERSTKKESSSNEDREDPSIDCEMTIGSSSVYLMQSSCIKVQQPINSEGTSTTTKYNNCDNIISKDIEASENMSVSIVEHESLSRNACFQTDTQATVSGLPQTICQRSVSTEASSLHVGSVLKNTQNESKDKIPDSSDDSSSTYISDEDGLSTIDNNVDDEVNSDRKVVSVQEYNTGNNLNYLDDCDALPYPSDALTCMLTNLQDRALSVTEMLGETVKERCVFDNVLHSNTTTVPKSSSVWSNNNLYKEETSQCHDRIRTLNENFDFNSTSSVDMKKELVEGVNKYSGIKEGNASTVLTSRIQSNLCQYSSNPLGVSNKPDQSITSSSEANYTESGATTLENLQPPNTSQIDINLHSNNTRQPHRVNTTPAIKTEDQINIHFDELSRIVFNVANKIIRTEYCKKKWLKKISDTKLSKQYSLLTLKTKSYIQSNMSIASQINRVLIKTIGYYKFITFLFRKVSLITHQTKNACSIDRKCFLKVYYLVLQADSEFFKHVKQSSLATVIDKIDLIMNIQYDSMVDDQATMDQYLNAAIGSKNYERLQESSNSTCSLDIPIFPNETPQQCAQQILTLSYIQQDQYKSQLSAPPIMVNNDLRRYQRDYKLYLQRVGALYCAQTANQEASGVINQGTHGMINNGHNGMANQGAYGIINNGTNYMTNKGANRMTIHKDNGITNQGAYAPTNHSTYGFSNRRTFGITSDVTSYDQLGQQNYDMPPLMLPNVYGKQFHEIPYSSNIYSQQYQGHFSTSSDISDYHYSTTPHPAISPTFSDISRHQLGVRVYSVSYDTSRFQHQNRSTCSSDGFDYHRLASDSLYPYDEQQLYCSKSSMSSDVARCHYQGHRMQSPVGMMSVGSYEDGMTPTTVMDIGCYKPEKRRRSKLNCRRRNSCRISVDSGIDQEIASPVTRESSRSDIQEVPESVLFVQELMRY